MTWSKPQFVLANTAEPAGETNSWKWSVSYVDAIVDRGLITLVIAHQHKRVVTVAAGFRRTTFVRFVRDAAPV